MLWIICLGKQHCTAISAFPVVQRHGGSEIDHLVLIYHKSVASFQKLKVQVLVKTGNI